MGMAGNVNNNGRSRICLYSLITWHDA